MREHGKKNKKRSRENDKKIEGSRERRSPSERRIFHTRAVRLREWVEGKMAMMYTKGKVAPKA